jgi:hypothetical protein
MIFTLLFGALSLIIYSTHYEYLGSKIVTRHECTINDVIFISKQIDSRDLKTIYKYEILVKMNNSNSNSFVIPKNNNPSDYLNDIQLINETIPCYTISFENKLGQEKKIFTYKDVSFKCPGKVGYNPPNLPNFLILFVFITMLFLGYIWDNIIAGNLLY